MASTNIYQDIAARTGGDIYIGVVGPVRTGKSTFIKKFMEALVLPNISDPFGKDRAVDEMPQSAAGRTIMTTEPKFIPNEAVQVTLQENASFRVRLIDCVGYIVPDALGYIENDQPRMVRTPWFEEPVPFNMAAETGTQKVIREHSTIGLVITTDGTIGEIAREGYLEAEERVIRELQEINKPFVVLLNTAVPRAPETVELCGSLKEKYGVPVVPVDCMNLSEKTVRRILEHILFEFPIRQIGIKMPPWINFLEETHPIRRTVLETITQTAAGLKKIRDTDRLVEALRESEHVQDADLDSVELGCGKVRIHATLPQELFYKILSETTGLTVENEGDLIAALCDLTKAKKQFDKIETAFTEANLKGYGIVTPSVGELSLEEPEITKQGGRYGVRLKASAPSYHIIKATIETEVAPIVGNEKQSEDLVKYLLAEFEQDPQKLWDSNIFGKSLHELVTEGLHTKLAHLTDESRLKLQETLERITNEGSGGLICIIL
ncbi:MAG: stage IV sporulation protein A [Clostridia bacterium]|nr:stage IV sporulation protein A [Clostridia bacterium]